MTRVAQVACSEYLVLLICVSSLHCLPLILRTAELGHLLLLLLRELSSTSECEFTSHCGAAGLAVEEVGDERLVLVVIYVLGADGQKLVCRRLAEEMVLVVLELELRLYLLVR